MGAADEMTKQETIFRALRGCTVTTEALAAKLGWPRSDVRKGVSRLRKLGVPIIGHGTRGYTLARDAVMPAQAYPVNRQHLTAWYRRGKTGPKAKPTAIPVPTHALDQAWGWGR